MEYNKAEHGYSIIPITKKIVTIICIIFLAFVPAHLLSQTNFPQESKFYFEVKVNHLVREQFYSASIIAPLKKNIYFELEYGYYHYHHASLNIGYRCDLPYFTPYIFSGILYNVEMFTNQSYYYENCLKLGGGFKFKLTRDFFLNLETSLIKYLSTNYTLQDVFIKETYKFNEMYDYSICISIGYHHNF